MTKADPRKHSPLKTCSRGHRYRGSRCPACWPAGAAEGAEPTGARTGKAGKAGEHGARRRQTRPS